MDNTMEALTEKILAAMQGYVERSTAPLVKRILDLESSLAVANHALAATNDTIGKQIDFNSSVIARFDSLPVPKDGKDGVDGKNADIDAMLMSMETMIDLRMSTLPKPENGKDGADGKSVDLAEVVEAVLFELPKPKDGVDGAAGKDAVVDYEALQTFILKSIPDPVPGLAGTAGQDGQDGQDGKDGQAGRDAFELEVESEIDVTRSYPRGTWARHAGGLWVTRGQQAGMASWECVVDGVASHSLDLATDGRTITVTCIRSSGAVDSSTFTLPVMIQRGVWNSDAEYERGDVTTRDGSSWHAERSSKGSEPGTLSSKGDWTLIVKHGRDYTPPERRPNGGVSGPVRLR